MDGVEDATFGFEVEAEFDLVNPLKVVIVLYSEPHSPPVLVKREPQRFMTHQLHQQLSASVLIRPKNTVFLPPGKIVVRISQKRPVNQLSQLFTAGTLGLSIFIENLVLSSPLFNFQAYVTCLEDVNFSNLHHNHIIITADSPFVKSFALMTHMNSHQ